MTEKYVCDCGKEFRRRVFLSLHKNTHNRFKVRCKFCGKVFYLHSQLHQHVRSHGFLHLRPPSRKGWSSYYPHRFIRCLNCSTTFLKPTQLSAHMFKVHGIAQRNRRLIPAKTYSTTMLSTTGKLTVSTRKPGICLESQDSNTENSYGISNSLELDGSSSPTFGVKSRSRSPKRAQCVHDSLTKSPSRLARERLLRKYHRPHVSSPANRKLFLDQQSSENNRIPNLRKRNPGNQDPNMPRLTEISILLERVDHHNINGSMFPRKEKNIVPKKNELIKEMRVKLEKADSWKRSDSSGSDDRMPHLHRFSSEEKAADDVDGGSETWISDNDSPTPICVDKFDGFKQREGLFDILQHEHEKTSPTNNEEKSNSTEKIIKPSNGLLVKKHILLDACKLSPTKQSDFPGSELITNNLSQKSQSHDLFPSESPALSDGKPQAKSHNETVQKHSGSKLSADETVLILPSNQCDHSHIELSFISNVQQIPPPLCYTEGTNESVSIHSPTLRPKKHHAEAINFMSDLSELKHEREDQAESYPNSLSSLEEGPDPVTQMVQNLHTHFVNRQRSCPVPVKEDVQLKRSRHMTVSGRASDLRDQSPAKARERKRRPKTLSHGCSCCMDLGPSRKKRRRFNRSKAKVGWSIPYILTKEQQTFMDSSKQLVSLRHKVFRLCQVLFPKLSPVWQLNADTEQVDMLVNEISGVIKSLKENKSQVQLPIKTSKLCNASDLHVHVSKCQDLSLNQVSLVKQTQPDSDIHLLNKPSVISGEVVNQNETDSLSSDSRLEDGNLSDNSSGHSVFLPVLDSEMTTDKLSLDIALPGDKPSSDNITTEATHLKEDHSNCSSSKENTPDDKLSPLNSCENVEQTSSEDIELGTETGQEILVEEQSSSSSRCESPKNINNNSSSQSNVSLTSPGDAMWGSGSNNQWETEFFQYLSKSTAFNKPKTLLTSKPFKKETNSLTAPSGETSSAAIFSCDKGTNIEQDIECESPLPKLLDFKVELCKDPKMCLTQLRRKVICLLQPLLPNLTLENNFDKFSDDVDMLVDLVTQSNERKVL